MEKQIGSKPQHQYHYMPQLFIVCVALLNTQSKKKKRKSISAIRVKNVTIINKKTWYEYQ